MDITSHETWSFKFRKKVRGLSALATIAGTIIWQPQIGRKFVLTEAYVYIPAVNDDLRILAGITGTVTTEPNIALTNGTDEVAASVDLPITNGSLLSLDVQRGVFFDDAHPLTLVQAIAQVGATRFKYDLILVATKLTD